jgi:hypothetical protein
LSPEALAMWRDFVEQSRFALHDALAARPPLSTIVQQTNEPRPRP